MSAAELHELVDDCRAAGDRVSRRTFLPTVLHRPAAPLESRTRQWDAMYRPVHTWVAVRAGEARVARWSAAVARRLLRVERCTLHGVS